MPILPVRQYTLILEDNGKKIHLPFRGDIKINSIPHEYHMDDLGFKKPSSIESEITASIDFKELTRCVLAQYPTIKKYVQAALENLEKQSAEAKETLEQAKYQARQAYRAQIEEIEAKYRELGQLAAILDPEAK